MCVALVCSSTRLQTLEAVVIASQEDLSMCPGIGPQKVRIFFIFPKSILNCCLPTSIPKLSYSNSVSSACLMHRLETCGQSSVNILPNTSYQWISTYFYYCPFVTLSLCYVSDSPLVATWLDGDKIFVILVVGELSFLSPYAGSGS